MKTATQNAIESYENEARFRAVAMSVVGEVMRGLDPETSSVERQEAHDVAVKVAVLLLQRVYEDDAELNALRTERDAYKKLALEFNAVSMRPISLVIPASEHA